VEIHDFADTGPWESWLADQHTSAAQAWLRIGKKNAGIRRLLIGDALDVALCYGWIDGQRQAYDDVSFLQRYCPRRACSAWSAINVAKVEVLTAAGRMRPAGLAEVAAAQADGRWEAAYESQRTAAVPPDLAAALAPDDAARAAFDRLSRTDRYMLILAVLKARTPDSRKRTVERTIERLRG
jgi:uncharacterized protein YdeI (YjbR/CyaY-like superfamily)